MNLLYFTDSYPFGYGEQWMTNELKELVKVYTRVEVIPFQYGNSKTPVDLLDNVVYHTPLFDGSLSRSAKEQLSSFLKSPYRSNFMREMFQHVGFSLNKLKQWISSSYTIHRVLSHPMILKKVIGASEPSVAYFFWGRKTAEITSFVQNPNIKSAIRLHGYDLYHYRSETGYLPYQKSQLMRADKVICISQDGASYLNRTYKNLTSKLLVNHLGTSPVKRSIRSFDGKFRIMSCSSLIPLKRVHIIAKALKHVSDLEIVWTHIGDGPEMDRIRNLTSNLSKNLQVSLPGWVESDAVTSYYAGNQVDLFINVSEAEGVPVSIMEAMAAGIPCLATNVGGMQEIVNETNGRLVEPDICEQKLALYISEFARLPEDVLNKKRDSALATHCKDFNAKTNAKELSKQLKSIW